MDDYLDKPLDRARLAQTLDRWGAKLAASAAAAAPRPLIDRAAQRRLTTEQLRERLSLFAARFEAAGANPSKLAPLRAEAHELGLSRLAQLLASPERTDVSDIVAVGHRSIEATIMLLDA
jgi:hypothetical protein